MRLRGVVRTREQRDDIPDQPHRVAPPHERQRDNQVPPPRRDPERVLQFDEDKHLDHPERKRVDDARRRQPPGCDGVQPQVRRHPRDDGPDKDEDDQSVEGGGDKQPVEGDGPVHAQPEQYLSGDEKRPACHEDPNVGDREDRAAEVACVPGRVCAHDFDQGPDEKQDDSAGHGRHNDRKEQAPCLFRRGIDHVAAFRAR
mmetsp:Transcript_3258/g.7734  ORF Transcript_3258/g.7734 Transcript_3258/m.7734 type:complete len:200 (-) Transcript_3258:727-1326(-)